MSARRTAVWIAAGTACLALPAALVLLGRGDGVRGAAALPVAAVPGSLASPSVAPPLLADSDGARTGDREVVENREGETESTAESPAPVAPPWDVVRTELVGRMYLSEAGLRDVLQNTIGSPLDPDAEWLESHFGPAASPAALAAAESAMIEHNLRIEFESRQYLDELALAVREIVDGERFARQAGPVEGLLAEEPLILLRSTSYRGWNTILTVSRNEFPDLARQQVEIVRMSSERNKLCGQLMRGG